MKKESKKPETFSQRFGKILDYLIQRRQYLLDAGYSMKREWQMRHLLDKFTPYKGHRWTNRGAARFLWYHFPELRQMIPEREINKLNELENLWLAAKNIFILENQNQKPCKQLSIF